MINFDSVDFSERCPEEVLSFFWHLVYIHVCTVQRPVSEMISKCEYKLYLGTGL